MWQVREDMHAAHLISTVGRGSPKDTPRLSRALQGVRWVQRKRQRLSSRETARGQESRPPGREANMLGVEKSGSRQRGSGPCQALGRLGERSGRHWRLASQDCFCSEFSVLVGLFFTFLP